MTTETASINVSDEDEAQLSGEDDHQNHNNNGSSNSASGNQQQTVVNHNNSNSVVLNSNEIANNLYKWTNYIHGWQERYIVLKDGILSYYKSETETQFGCRGAIALKQSTITAHDLDDCRFDIRVNDSVWYLRAKTVEERQKWLEAIDEHRGESGYGSQTSLRRHGSMLSLNSTASLSVASTGSYKRGLGLNEKLAEMDTFKDILCRQVETLQTYFDACANSLTKGFEPYHKEFEKNVSADDDYEDEEPDDATIVNQEIKSRNESMTNSFNKMSKDFNKARIEDHAAMALDFKGEAFTFKATAAGILSNLAHCIELMQQREDFLKKKLNKEIEKRKKLEEHVKELSKAKKKSIIIAGPDFEEGPHSTIKEEQFFDAIDSTLDTLEQEEERRVQAFESLTKLPELKPVSQHRLSVEIEKVVQEHLKFDLQDDLDSNVWELLCSDGEMKIFRRELEENGVVLDPLKAVHTVQGITGHELCKYFWDPAVRMEWEGTLDSSRMIEALSDDTLLFHQIHKRVWPSAQRDTCFWSHIRSVPHKQIKPNDNSTDIDDWIVVNYSTTHDAAPPKDPLVRAWANVSMLCTTLVKDRQNFKNLEDVPRQNLICKINYVAQVNPGGWAPANVLRAVYKREYPKFVKRFTQYVIDKTAKKPILFK